MRRYVVRLQPGAKSDLDSLRTYITGQSGPVLADEFVGRLLAHLEGFDVLPKRGTERPDVRENLRLIGWDKVVTIAFEVRDAIDEVWIIAISYRGIDLAARLKD